jgi:hypothetical protein
MNAPDAVEILRALVASSDTRDSVRVYRDEARAILDHITALTAEHDAAVAEVVQIVAWLWACAAAGDSVEDATYSIERGAHKRKAIAAGAHKPQIITGQSEESE